MAHKNKSNISPYKTRQMQRGVSTSTEARPLKGTHKRPEQVFSVHEANDRLYDIFKNHDFEHITHEQRLKLAEFYRLLMLNQEKENFTRLLKLRDIAIKHFIDCLIVLKYTNLSFPLMDMGTGPGFPGIPLKIALPEDKRIILTEGVQRRVEFLKHVREEMQLKNLDIIGRNVNFEFVYPVQGVITRAVEDVGNTLGNVINSLQTGGYVYLMKGPNVDPEIEAAEKTWGEHYVLEKDIAYDLPKTEHKRRLLIYKKIKMGPLLDLEDLGLLEDDDND